VTEGSLFNSGFLGENFNWWIGQITDDSYWRDNIVGCKYKNPKDQKGWGARYKVRIIGLHDQEETSIASDQLPWAQVMYPVTAGGGQGGTWASSALRQGNFVFGFFLDGADQEVPIIMGVLGNNIQTTLNQNFNKNFVPISGFAIGKKKLATALHVPDFALVTEKPDKPSKSESIDDGIEEEENKEIIKAGEIAKKEAEERGYTKDAVDSYVKAAKELKQSEMDKSGENSENDPTPGSAIESPSSPHLLNVADVKRNVMYLEKIAMLNPCNMVQSAMKAIQTEIENLVNKINGVLKTVSSYVNQVANIIKDIRAIIADVACIIAKYMKIIFDKILQYLLKKLNSSLKDLTNLIPPSLRFKYFDIREKITELINCLFSKITNGLCGQIQNLIDPPGGSSSGGSLSGGSSSTTVSPGSPPSYQLKLVDIISSGETIVVQSCAIESLVSDIISQNLEDIQTGLKDSIEIVGNFAIQNVSSLSIKNSKTNKKNSNISDLLNQVDDVLETAENIIEDVQTIISKITSTLNGISGSLTAAMSFTNLSVKIFGCDLGLSCPGSDYFTLQSGSGGAEDFQLPRIALTANKAKKPPTKVKKNIPEIPFAVPGPQTEDVKNNSPTIKQETVPQSQNPSTTAAAGANAAQPYAQQASGSAQAAGQSAGQASGSATAAGQSAGQASGSAQAAGQSAQQATPQNFNFPTVSQSSSKADANFASLRALATLEDLKVATPEFFNGLSSLNEQIEKNVSLHFSTGNSNAPPIGNPYSQTNTSNDLTTQYQHDQTSKDQIDPSLPIKVDEKLQQDILDREQEIRDRERGDYRD
jgi:hypothetical protein